MSNPLSRHYTKIYILSALLALTLIAAIALGTIWLLSPNEYATETDPPYRTTTPSDDNTQPPSQPTHTYEDVVSANTNRGSLILINSDRHFDPAAAQNVVSIGQSAGIDVSHSNHNVNSNLASALIALGAEMLSEFPAGRTLEIIQSFTGRYFANHDNERTSGLTVGTRFWDAATRGQFVLSEPAVSEQYQWILANAHRFGIVQRYPQAHAAITGMDIYLPGHFRYVGIPHATFMHNNNMVLEQYLYLLETTHDFHNRLNVTLDGQRWQVYFVPVQAGQTTPVPIPYGASNYVISGNNGGRTQTGFVVTIRVN